MRILIIMIGVLGLSVQMYAKDISYDGLSRKQMLVEAKHLIINRAKLETKQEAWLARRQVLVSEFERDMESADYFGEHNAFGKRRMQRRKNDFFASLKSRDDEVNEKIDHVDTLYKRLEDTFSSLYAVPLTVAEIEGGKSPRVADKQKKIRLLEAYVRAENLWKNCLKKSESFDSEYLDIQTNLEMSVKKYTQLQEKLDQKVEKNMISLGKHDESFHNAITEYNENYGYTIDDPKLAKKILSNIKKAH